MHSVNNSLGEKWESSSVLQLGCLGGITVGSIIYFASENSKWDSHHKEEEIELLFEDIEEAEDL